MTFQARPEGIFLNGIRLNIFGVNWFGAEISGCPHGLWSVSWRSVLDDFMVKQGVNMIRFPMSVEMALDMDASVPDHINYDQNPDLRGLTSGQVMDKIFDGCRERGILVMPNFHRLKSGEEIPELWYRDPDFPESKVISAWSNVVRRYINNPYVFAVDLKNEPHGRATWHVGNPATDWADACERMGNAILKVNPNILVVVEGLDTSSHDSTRGLGAYWGEMLDGVRVYPVKLSVPDRVVYSPHSYGPDVFMMDFYRDPNVFPANMPDIWARKFHFIAKERLGCVLIGELGGRYEPGTLDEKWHDAFTSFVANDPYLKGSVCIWAFNANSGIDTKGLVKDDWKTVDTRKMEVYKKMCPNPTSIKDAFAVQMPQQSTVVMNQQTSTAAAVQPQSVTTTTTTQKPPKPPTNTPSVLVNPTTVWVENGVEFTRYELTVKNTTNKPMIAKDVSVKINLTDVKKQSVRQSWGCALASNAITMPNWMLRLEPGKEWTFGVIVSGTNVAKATFSLIQKAEKPPTNKK